MERAQKMLHNTERRQGQLLKKRSQAVAELQRQQAKGLNPDQLAIFLASVSDADRAIADITGRIASQRDTIFRLKQARAASKALKKMVKQEDAAKDGDDSGGDLIRAVHGASSAPATNEVARPKAAPITVGGMVGDMANAACVTTGIVIILIVGGTGLMGRKLRLW